MAGAAAATPRPLRPHRTFEPGGLSSRERSRLALTGPNELVRARQLRHPLALLLWIAAALAWPTSGVTLAVVIVGVILLNVVVWGVDALRRWRLRGSS